MIRRRRYPRILMTGFGPFPGQPFNASAALVQMLAEDEHVARMPVQLHMEILPTDWREAPALVRELVAGLRPDAILHFGVSSRARHFEIETRAFNVARCTADCRGKLPEGHYLLPGAPPALCATFPSHLLHRRLRLEGVPASVSRDAGRYLCNAILYRSLHMSRTVRPAPRVGFIHIPALSGPRSNDFESRRWAAAQRGGSIIIHTLAQFLRCNRLGARALI